MSADGGFVVSGTRQLTGAGQLEEVKEAMRECLDELDLAIPPYLMT